MSLSRLFLGILFSIPLAQCSVAQQAQEWIPQGVEVLRQTASSKTEFSLDHSMLVLASKMDSENADLRRVIAGVSGVSVHEYRFPGSWMYDESALSSVKDEYHAAGWKQLMNRHDKGAGPGATELWIRFQNNAVSNIAILVARANEVSFIQVSGSISPLDLSHLGGHFGIPRIEGGVRIPNDRRLE